jgi:hypothetical protein
MQVLESLRALKELPYTAPQQPASGPEPSTAAAAGTGAGTAAAAAAVSGGDSMQRADSAASGGVTDASGPLADVESPPEATTAAAVSAATAVS